MKKHISLLIVEDSDDDAALLMRELGRAFDISFLRVDTSAQLGTALIDGRWDIVITDYVMPALSGTAAVNLVRGRGLDLPIIIVSGVIGEDLAVEAMKAGANDYILKSNLLRLVPAVERELREAEGRRSRRVVEERLRQSERKFRNLLESLPIGIVVLDMEKEIIEMNQTMVDMFGYGSKEELRSVPREGLYFDVRDRVRIFQQLALGLPADVEVLMRRKDGGLFWAAVNSAVKTTEDDDSYIINIFQNITGRKLAEAALLDSEERFRQIFQQNEDAQIIIDCRAKKVIDANPAMVGLYGFTRDEIIGGSISLILPRYDCEALEEMLGSADKSNGFRLERVENVRKDGTRMIVSVRGQRVRLEYSDVVYCTLRDITERVRLQEEARIMQSQLIHANKMTSIGIMSSGVAHEINNPNNFILSNSSILAAAWQDTAKILDEYYRENGEFSIGGLPYSEMRGAVPELLTGISEGARRVKRIVEDLKNLARPDVDGLDGEADVNQAVKAAASILGHKIDQCTEVFILALDDNLPKVRGSVQKIEQVMINLILNALQALRDRDGAVRVSTAHEPRNNCVLITVEDEGGGMSPAALARATEPFFTTRADDGGTGLGLAISYSIIKEHSGTIEFKSLHGKGTAVYVRLPAPA